MLDDTFDAYGKDTGGPYYDRSYLVRDHRNAMRRNSMSILDKFADVKVLVVGDIMLDRYWWGSVKRISPEAPVPVVELQRSTFAPGGAANVAANIAGLGATAYLVGTVGADNEADMLIGLLEDVNVSA